MKTPNVIIIYADDLGYGLGQQKNLAWRYPKIAKQMAERIEAIKKNEK